MIYLACQDPTKPVLVRRIADATHVPRQMLAKILHRLKGKGLVSSTKGPGGGYQLAKSSQSITLQQVVEAVEGPLHLREGCVLGLAECSDEARCALHDFWKVFREQYWTAIHLMTLEDAAATIERKQRRAVGDLVWPRGR